MESTWTLKTEDDHIIYGCLNSADLKKSRSAIFIAHGLTGHMYEYAFKRAADYFGQDYDVYRFNLYDGRDRGRELINCTVQTHANDLKAVLDHFGSSYERKYLIGHSYGGPTIMLANPDGITATSLWDPSFNLSRIQKEFSKNYTPHGDFYIVNWGTSYLINKDMYREAGKMNFAYCTELAKNFKSPVQVIHAKDGFYANDDVSYHSFGDQKNIREFVDGTTHCFYEGQSCDDLLSKTKNWLEKFK